MKLSLVAAIFVVYGIIGSQACFKPNNVSPTCGRQVGTSTCRRFKNSCQVDKDPSKYPNFSWKYVKYSEFSLDFQEVQIEQCLDVYWTNSPCATGTGTTCNVNEECIEPVVNLCGMQTVPASTDPNAPLPPPPQCRTFRHACELRRFNCQQRQRQQKINPTGPAFVDYVLTDDGSCRGIAITPKTCVIGFWFDKLLD